MSEQDILDSEPYQVYCTKYNGLRNRVRVNSTCSEAIGANCLECPYSRIYFVPLDPDFFVDKDEYESITNEDRLRQERIKTNDPKNRWLLIDI